MYRIRAPLAWWGGCLAALIVPGSGCATSGVNRPAGPGARAQDFYMLVGGPEFTDQSAWSTIELADAQRVSTGRGAVIALLDTGVDFDHPRLAGRIVNGGYDFVDRDGVAREAATGDMAGHGTFLAGVLASVAPEAAILPVRVLDGNGVAVPAAVAAGIRHAVRQGADIINLGVGGLHDDGAVAAALAEARRAGVLVVAAAGNLDDEHVEFPASHESVIAVAATDAGDRKAAFSSYGAEVALSAPGVDVVSTVPGGAYGQWSGTSVSAAMVSGTVALLRADDPAAGIEALEQALFASAKGLNATDPLHAAKLGAGRLDAAGALLVLRGDLDANGRIDVDDAAILSKSMGQREALADLDRDGTVSGADLLMLLAAMD